MAPFSENLIYRHESRGFKNPDCPNIVRFLRHETGKVTQGLKPASGIFFETWHK